MKRMVALTLAIFVVLSCGLCIPASAQTDASYTICGSSATLNKGDKPGELFISYTVTANMRAASLGVKTIKIYTDTSKLVKTISGTTANGLVDENHVFHGGTYYFTGTPGQYYYAEVTVFAATDTVSDSYTHLTDTIRAPY